MGGPDPGEMGLRGVGMGTRGGMGIRDMGTRDMDAIGMVGAIGMAEVDAGLPAAGSGRIRAETGRRATGDAGRAGNATEPAASKPGSATGAPPSTGRSPTTPALTGSGRRTGAGAATGAAAGVRVAGRVRVPRLVVAAKPTG
jgi:hypothetical protein